MLKGIHHKSGYHTSNHIKSEVPRLAPATKGKYHNLETEKKKYNYKSNPYVGAQAVSIARRNARERNRVKQVNDGFNALRKRLPASVIAALSGGSRRGSGKKLSKVDTLHMVVEYIRYLQNVLEKSDAAIGEMPKDTYLSYEDEGIYGGSCSYSESVPSPVGSECSSGVSVNSKNCYIANDYLINGQFNTVNQDDLLDTISWWQQK